MEPIRAIGWRIEYPLNRGIILENLRTYLLWLGVVVILLVGYAYAQGYGLPWLGSQKQNQTAYPDTTPSGMDSQKVDDVIMAGFSTISGGASYTGPYLVSFVNGFAIDARVMVKNSTIPSSQLYVYCGPNVNQTFCGQNVVDSRRPLTVDMAASGQATASAIAPAPSAPMPRPAMSQQTVW